jgi:hypothetical protein
MRILHILLAAAGSVSLVNGQEMQPRAYQASPIGINFFGVSYANSRGGLLFDPSLPVEDAHVVAHVTTLSFAQSFGVFGRSAQALAILPYVKADLNGQLAGVAAYRYRSGLGDSAYRFSINIHGGPALHLREFAALQQKFLVGASVTVAAPTGQYSPGATINLGTNRWGFKPEVGIARSWNKWTLEGALGVWLYTDNSHYLVSSRRHQDPIGSVQAHVVRVLPKRTWVALDGTFFTGGRSYTNGRPGNDYQGNSRVGATFGIAVRRRHSFRVSYFESVRTRVGGNLRSIGVAYSVLWLKGH